MNLTRGIFPGLLAVAAAIPGEGPLARAAEERGQKENLDLGGTGSGDDHGRVTFYGEAPEGDGCFFLVQLGTSLAGHGAEEPVKAQLIAALAGLSSDAEFGLVLFGTGVHRFPPSGRPASAGAAEKRTAEAWLRSVHGACGASFAPAFREALALARRSSARRNILFCLGGGPEAPSEALTAVEAEGIRLVRIDHRRDEPDPSFAEGRGGN